MKPTRIIPILTLSFLLCSYSLNAEELSSIKDKTRSNHNEIVVDESESLRIQSMLNENSKLIESNTTKINSFGKRGQFVILFAILISIITLILTLRNQAKLKNVDVLMNCEKRYYEILKLKKAVSNKTEEKGFYEQYWSYQHFQFTVWRMGVISNETYRFWIKLKLSEFEKNKKVKDISYREGWEQAAVKFEGTDFKKFFDEISEFKKESLNKVIIEYTKSRLKKAYWRNKWI